MQFGESCGGYATAPLNTVNPTTAAVPASNTCGTIISGTGTTAATLGTPLVISDCSTAHIFRVSATGGTTQNKDNTGATVAVLGKTYPATSEIMLFRSYTYFIRENPAGQPALYRLDNNTASTVAAVELVEGIEDMQIKYGVDADANGVPEQYMDVPTGSDYTKVNSVRVWLHVRSIDDNLIANQRPYNYNNVATSDKRLMRTFTTTIGLRNR